MKQKKTLKKENTQNSIQIFMQRVWVYTSLKFIEHQWGKQKFNVFDLKSFDLTKNNITKILRFDENEPQ